MDDLNKFFKQVKGTNMRKDVMTTVNINTPYFNEETFKQNLFNTTNFSDQDLYMFISTCMDRIVEDILNNDSDYISVITNHRFMDTFSKIMTTTPITAKKRLCCNKLAYDYLTLGDSDLYTKQKLLGLSMRVNSSITMRLTGLGLDNTTAGNLALSRYSSSNEIVNVKRLNFTICNLDSNIMTEQMIINIYEIMFDRITPLFEGAMFETYDEDCEEVFGENFMANYSTISLAVLTILNNMPISDIKHVISTYIKNWNVKQKPSVRFSLRSLSGDFSRIKFAVEELIISNTFVP